jgi:transposase-like protein
MNETMTTKRRRQFTAADRSRWMEQYQRSGQSVRDFCRDQGLCQSSLSRWLRQRRAATQVRYHEGSMVEVRVAPVADSAAGVKVRLPGGVTMEVASGTDAGWLAGVLRALQPIEG